MKLEFDNDGQCQFSCSTPIPVILIEIADRVHQVVRLTVRGSRRDNDELVLRPGGATEAVKLSVSECAGSAQIASAILTLGQPGQDVGSEIGSSNSSKPDPRVISILARTMFTITPSRIEVGRIPISLVRELSEIYSDLRNEARFRIRDDPMGQIAELLSMRDQTVELRRIVGTLEAPATPSSIGSIAPTASEATIGVSELAKAAQEDPHVAGIVPNRVDVFVDPAGGGFAVIDSEVKKRIDKSVLTDREWTLLAEFTDDGESVRRNFQSCRGSASRSIRRVGSKLAKELGLSGQPFSQSGHVIYSAFARISAFDPIESLADASAELE